MTKALMRGGREHFGWGREHYMLADLYDAMNLNTQATGNWKNKAPDIPKYPTPKLTPKAKKRTTVKEIYAAWMK